MAVWPMVDFKGNVKLETLSKEDVPREYQIFEQAGLARGSLFFPASTLYFDWSPYPVKISGGQVYKDLFSNNARVVNDRQADLYAGFYEMTGKNNLSNLYLFGGEDAFVFKDIRNDDNRKFDYFDRNDYAGLSEAYYQKLNDDPHFSLVEENGRFAHFVAKDSGRENFLLYNPKSILFIDPEDFFASGAFDPARRLMVIDPQSPSFSRVAKAVPFDQDLKISIKLSAENATQYPFKVENFRNKPFLLQLNKTFGSGWKIKWVSKEYFESRKCAGDWEEDPVSGNAACLTDISAFELQNIRLLFSPALPEKDHFEGNFVGNGWQVRPEDIPQDMQNRKELYGVVIYQKQIYYVWLTALAGLVALGLICIPLVISARNILRKNNENF